MLPPVFADGVTVNSGMQAVAPLTSEVLPLGQTVCVDAPDMGTKKPGEAGVQEVWPGLP